MAIYYNVYHAGWNIRRQIDYIMINAKRRTVTRKAQINIY